MSLDPAMAVHLAAMARDCDACERSWSIHDGGVEERLLFFADHQPGRALRMAEAAVALGFPAALLQGWSRALPGADAIGLAVNRSGSSVRLYVQYWEAVKARVMGGDLAPAPLYVGFKALPGGVLRQDVYFCAPAAPRDRFWPPMRDALVAWGCAAAAAEAAFAPVTAGNCLFTETVAEGRSSWLATLRRAPLQARAVADCLAPLAEGPGREGLRAALAGGAGLVHLAAGEDAVKGRFLTVYLEEAAPEAAVARMVNPPSQ